MEVVVKSAKPPIMRVVPKSIDFVLPTTVDVHVVYPNETKYNAFTLDLVSTHVHLIIAMSNGCYCIRHCTVMFRFGSVKLKAIQSRSYVLILQWSSKLYHNYVKCLCIYYGCGLYSMMQFIL